MIMMIITPTTTPTAVITTTKTTPTTTTTITTTTKMVTIIRMITTNMIKNFSSNSRTVAHEGADGSKVVHIIKATKQERGETLGRIAVRTAYDPWELLNVLTQAMGTTPSQLDCIQPAPPYILKTRTPLYDLIIVDCLYPVLSPYINITVPDLKSVSTTGTVGLLGTDFASVL